MRHIVLFRGMKSAASICLDDAVCFDLHFRAHDEVVWQLSGGTAPAGVPAGPSNRVQW